MKGSYRSKENAGDINRRRTRGTCFTAKFMRTKPNALNLLYFIFLSNTFFSVHSFHFGGYFVHARVHIPLKCDRESRKKKYSQRQSRFSLQCICHAFQQRYPDPSISIKHSHYKNGISNRSLSFRESPHSLFFFRNIQHEITFI